jgi:hypothetical protein
MNLKKLQWTAYWSQHPADMKVEKGNIVMLTHDEDGLEVYARVEEIRDPGGVFTGTVIGFDGRLASIDPSKYPIEQLGNTVTFSKEEVWACYQSK